ncbi:MAG: alkaline phosphatase PhoX, partial [Opitutales bacterium]
MKNRRHFLQSASAIALGFGGLRNFSACAEKKNDFVVSGYGPLLKDPQRVLELPKGFSYEIVGRSGEKMDDGFFVPAAPDGMAAFPGPNGLTLLVRNHEVSPGVGAGSGPFGSRNVL